MYAKQALSSSNQDEEDDDIYCRICSPFAARDPDQLLFGDPLSRLAPPQRFEVATHMSHRHCFIRFGKVVIRDSKCEAVAYVFCILDSKCGFTCRVYI